MKTIHRNNELEILESSRIALENALAQSQIAIALAELGYDATTIEEGKNILSATQSAFQHNRTEDEESSDAYRMFSEKKEALSKTYGLHRKKAKVIFKKDSATSEKIGITGATPLAYLKFVDTTKTFYTQALQDTAIQNKLARLKISPEELQDAEKQIAELEVARAFYLREKGESQEATQLKDQAFSELDDWMADFYAVAKIALEDQPQLLESLGILVRS